MGPVESVIAKTATQARRIEAEDSGAAVLKFRSGALGVLEVSVLTYPRNLEGSITLLGERGSVKIGGTAVNKVEHWSFAEYDDDDKLVESSNTAPPTVYGFGHEGYYRNVLAVLRADPARKQRAEQVIPLDPVIEGVDQTPEGLLAARPLIQARHPRNPSPAALSGTRAPAG